MSTPMSMAICILTITLIGTIRMFIPPIATTLTIGFLAPIVSLHKSFIRHNCGEISRCRQCQRQQRRH